MVKTCDQANIEMRERQEGGHDVNVEKNQRKKIKEIRKKNR